MATSPMASFRYRRSNEEMMKILKRKGITDLSKATPTQLQGLAEEVFVEEEVPLRSLRSHPLTIDQGGAQLVQAPSKVDFDSAEFRAPSEYFDIPNDTQALYYKEIEQVAKNLLGPNVRHLFCTSHILRQSSENATAVGDTAGPIKTVHNDFTEIYGDQLRERYTDHPSKSAGKSRDQLRHLTGLSFTKEELEKYRVVVLNTWRPIHKYPHPLRREPLAVCDNRSILKSDLMKRVTDIGKNDEDPLDDFALEVFLSVYNQDHRWHYVDDFTSQELLVFKTYDSDQIPFIPTMHSAFNLPNQDSEPERESVEARVICLMERPPKISKL